MASISTALSPDATAPLMSSDRDPGRTPAVPDLRQENLLYLHSSIKVRMEELQTVTQQSTN